MKIRLLSFALFGICLTVATAQNSTVRVKVRAALYDRDLNLKPIPNLALKLVPTAPSTAVPIKVQTTLDGIAEVTVPQGKYRVLTEKPVELFDKSFLWDFEVEFTGPENTLELSNANAAVTPIAGGRGARVDELAYQFKRVKNSVVTVWTDQGAIDGLVIDAAGLILTTQKPLEKNTWLAVQFDDRHRLPALILANDKAKDVAVLRVNPSEMGAILPAEISDDPGALVEGERVFVVENPGKDDNKKLTTGVLSKADQKEIISDVKLTYPGATLFNSSGSVVGLIQASEKRLYISPILVAQTTIQEAKQKLVGASLPSAHLLPTPPLDDFPADQLRAPGRGSWEKEIYSFKAGEFTVELVDPISAYETDNERYQRAMKDYAKHPKGKTEPTEPEHKYSPMLIVVAIPQTKTSWGETILSGMAAGPYSSGPTYKHYKTGFKRMRMICGDKEVEPIWPSRFVAGSQFGYGTVVEDEAFSGQYYYAHDAISPHCGKVTLQLFSTSDPDHPLEKVLDDRTVSRLWSDFEPYRKTQVAKPVIPPVQ
jgi:hypothetical protein